MAKFFFTSSYEARLVDEQVANIIVRMNLHTRAFEAFMAKKYEQGLVSEL